MTVSIDSQRLWDSLMAMAEIGPTENGGSCRLALTEEDAAGRRLLIEWCEAIGCSVKVDRVGNLFIRRSGTLDDLDPVATGSHLDTQPRGGRFDGILGVLAGLEVFRTLHDRGIVTERPLELVIWTNEEGSRFAPAMVASGTYAGEFSVESTLAREDRDGVTLGEALEATGFAGTMPVGEPRLAAFFELHIEQGPVLEEEGESLGVVTGVQGMRWFDVTFTGQSAHAGPTPMRYRHDALAAAARLIDRLQSHALADESGDTKVTCGCLDIVSASRNVIPGGVRLSVDLRHVVEAELDALEAVFERELMAASDAFGVEVRSDRIWKSPVVHFNTGCIEAVETAVKAQGVAYRRMMSGAGHDSVYVSRVAPTAMIFIPCRDGISHNEAEYATPEHCALGCQVLLEAILEKAGMATV
ncbi:allantoate amidohydrolase [Litchfieldella anticariensis FP35 = DSM 16096]|uniref:Allantoate amidohydrolase n=1 Tax=Litchfieldella anticariensis (strain DSM 16096 / CECT 5854 / CIP 108499 / LMG 22089 / FP35) TaxID=1121939 RepID=S2KJ79_LITA3|nr:M20 family metallo-hydrolase [Halomonas anticariensis]EPC02020.1 allantoate amidohydrolase [Halomonas anticariensis FP35 = DSM 16096]